MLEAQAGGALDLIGVQLDIGMELQQFAQVESLFIFIPYRSIGNAFRVLIVCVLRLYFANAKFVYVIACFGV